jgi:hypothetical protein
MKTVDELNDLRKRVLAGEEFSPEAYREIIVSYREARLAGVSAAAPKAKAKAEGQTAKAPVDLQVLLGSLGLAKKE